MTFSLYIQSSKNAPFLCRYSCILYSQCHYDTNTLIESCKLKRQKNDHRISHSAVGVFLQHFLSRIWKEKMVEARPSWGRSRSVGHKVRIWVWNFGNSVSTSISNWFWKKFTIGTYFMIEKYVYQFFCGSADFEVEALGVLAVSCSDFFLFFSFRLCIKVQNSR